MRFVRNPGEERCRQWCRGPAPRLDLRANPRPAKNPASYLFSSAIAPLFCHYFIAPLTPRPGDNRLCTSLDVAPSRRQSDFLGQASRCRMSRVVKSHRRPPDERRFEGCFYNEPDRAAPLGSMSILLFLRCRALLFFSCVFFPSSL